MTAATRRAMVLAAGLGRRMAPLTDARPKPLIEVAGKCLIDWSLDRLQAAGVETVVVNCHHHAELVRTHLSRRATPRTVVLWEPDLLETGGGVVNALDQLGSDAFFVVNSDAIWLDRPGEAAALSRLTAAWHEADMDALLLLHDRQRAIGHDGDGDFLLAADGRLSRRERGTKAPFLFAGVQLLHPRLFAGAPDGPFSLNLLYDRALAAGRLYGTRHAGEWLHVGTPKAVAEAEAFLAADRGGGSPP